MNVSNEIQRFRGALQNEHDSCGIVSFIEKENIPTKKNIDDTIKALLTMNHRAGFINEEGDGVGIHIDIPRALWKEKLNKANLDAAIVDSPSFVVGHLFIEKTNETSKFQQEMKDLFEKNGFRLIFESTNETNSAALGPIAQKAEPVFWQIALEYKDCKQSLTMLRSKLFDLTLACEKNLAVHVASLSHESAVYKVMGAGDILPKYYPDLANPLVASAMTLGHNRYSTNTLSNFFRVQPFSVIGHNGEINTIAKLRDEANMIGVPLVDGGSDSQDLNRVIDTFTSRHHLSLFETMEILFPPIVNEIKHFPAHLKDLYTYIREAWGHYAQGPAGIISRLGDEAVFSVDSLGLRPVWMLETDTSYIFSSEQGIFTTNQYVSEPKPFAPGEKVALKRNSKGTITILWHDELQEEVYNRLASTLQIKEASDRLTTQWNENSNTVHFQQNVTPSVYSANGWDREHIQLIEQMAEKGVEPIRSLGHDAPLAAMHPGRKNVADFIKESVAVVTNPAIDRDREMEHFSTRVVIGKRPELFLAEDLNAIVHLDSPITAEGLAGKGLQDEFSHPSFEGLLEYFDTNHEVMKLTLGRFEDESVEEALSRLTHDAVSAINNNKTLLVFDDQGVHDNELFWLDPHLAISAVDQGLTYQELRRHCSLVIRSGSIRTLHDIAVIFGLGADLINPYIMFASVVDNNAEPAVKLYSALNKGLEKIISTIGIHELRGYGRLFSSIGLNEDIAKVLNIVNYLGSKDVSYGFLEMKKDSEARFEDYHDEKAKPGKTFHIFPRIWKSLGDLASGKITYKEYGEKVSEQEMKNPTTIRHFTDLKARQSDIQPDNVDVSVGQHDLPFMISSMSFGSQNEVAFRAYAEAADRLNMISFNGEGGEIKDMLGKYPNTRGQQIASGRFGVNVELLNSSNLLEIKIGQGAKPGEGGHLPGSKVTDKVAAARNATTGSDLISPSNNHDIYSIEDLSQMIAELKTANDQAKVTVKVPIVPNIGTIAVGIAKAGADYITLSGFDGGTGAARVHALQHVGLPAEIGVKAAHFALLEAGLRHKVEIWADGGVKSVQDAIKLMLLGANRIGFGTLSMIAVGCTACRGCHLDTCHVGIATQIETVDQAKDHGLRRFVPREYDLAVNGLMNLFTEFGKELQALTAALGFDNTQDLVGRSDLLEQTRGHEHLDLTDLLATLPEQDVAPFEPVNVLEEIQEQQLAVAVGSEFEYLDANVSELTTSREFEAVTAEQRILGSRVSCHRVRGKLDGSYRTLPEIDLRYTKGSILGNGLGAYNSDGVNIHISGGAQDGVGKTSFGGSFKVFKTQGLNGQLINGSVGKGIGYGAQKGTFIIQGDADSRAGIRLSGADMIFGGRVKKPLKANKHYNTGIHANIKGFAFEYMTNGRGLVMGDPGPWMAAGMTGGVVYLRHDPQMGLDEKMLNSRIAKGAKVTIEPLTDKGVQDVVELLTIYHDELLQLNQTDEAAYVEQLLADPVSHFRQVTPVKQQADPAVSTE
ncbi:glutamate synthase [Salipaludibacillus agaradhaerens]|uniref:Glutamate synthase n=1 Tax=Salipaludibacillus agaradhaerens TaxID=76935 RepID=A0A9Q4B2L3_SALAG|nr:glutamate synthase-related protein [Salipaludibacillus agaradhaerens]MCR6097199.1 glutamate synthase [Salipaludibacillus agaradhaerens]MCR6113316.1 glutamate synthase [Salipaludibacillus agaradhaerens]